MAILDSLMSGGYEPDTEMDIMSDLDLYIEEMENAASEMTLDQLYKARFDALMDEDTGLAEIFNKEIDSRNPCINIPAVQTLADEPWYLDDPEHEDRRKEYLENYAADELPL